MQSPVSCLRLFHPLGFLCLLTLVTGFGRNPLVLEALAWLSPSVTQSSDLQLGLSFHPFDQEELFLDMPFFHTQFTHTARMHDVDRPHASFLVFMRGVTRQCWQFCTCRKCTRCRNRPTRFTEPGHSHREVERCGEAEGTGTTSAPPAMRATSPLHHILHSLGVFRTCLNPLSGQGWEKSVLIWFNSKYLSHNGDGGCVVHVHMFSGFHEQHAVRCDQRGQIELVSP